MGATLEAAYEHFWKLGSVSTHAPVMGATYRKAALVLKKLMFQPTRP